MPKASKYKAIRTEVDGITFASKKEAQRYTELKLLERNEEIEALTCHPKFELLHADGSHVLTPTGRKMYFEGDFKYIEKGMSVVEDVKGYINPALPPYKLFWLKANLAAKTWDFELRVI